MIRKSVFDQIKAHAQEIFRVSKGSHDWEHTQRVLALAERLARAEGADLEIVRYAALLHDIARAQEDAAGGRIDHARRGAEIAAMLLKKYRLPTSRIERITHCVATHRFRGAARPRSLEAKVLFDADKIDSIGAVGIGRAFLFAGEVGAKLHNPGPGIESTKAYSEDDTAYREFRVKLRKVRGRILTNTGKRLARERHEFMADFFKRLDEEVKGSR